MRIDSPEKGEASSLPEEKDSDLPFNPSRYGLVHLPPLARSEGGSLPAASRSNSRRPNASVYEDQAEFLVNDLPQVSRSHSVSGSNSNSGSSRSFSGTGDSALSEYMTVKFEHVEDEDGHHVVVGREGKLRRCEDEPIRTPGSVQGFGVLIAVDEQQDALVNSTELLGLPPRYLFTLECFTDTLPETQADTLWDNIQFLMEPDLAHDEEASPHVFLLSGYGAPGSAAADDKNATRDGKRMWTCWCAVHRAVPVGDKPLNTGLIIMEFELEKDTMNPLYPLIPPESAVGQTGTLNDFADGDDNWLPTAEDILESTTSRAKPLPALERLRRMNRTGWDPNPDITSPDEGLSRPRRTARRGGRGNTGVGMMDVFAVMGQINEQLGAAPDLDTFLKVVVGVIKDLTQFHRVLVYQFDEMWNGLVVAELVDWSQTHDLYKGLHFPAADIPAQARQLYAVNKVRLLYDRSQPTARLVVRNEDDLDTPLNMTHCYLRAMSPIHIKYLENMGVRASMSVSIVAFDQLWGLVTCHSYGSHGMRVSFPVRQILRLLSQLSYARRIHTRKLINTLTSERHPSGYIVSNADDLLALFDADFGILVIGEGAKILGPNQHGQELLIMAEYLRLKQFTTTADSRHSSGFEIIAGLLYVPLSSGGKDFIAFLRKGQPREVHWAGKPYKEGHGTKATLEPRTSFKIWSETVAGRCRAWTEEQLETAGVLALVYGKFIEVWRQKESALQTTKLTNILLSNASHEVRTPLNHIINYLEMALNGPLDLETRDNLRLSHAASKSLLFTINDLLDLTRLESGNETSFNEPFDLHFAIEDATTIYRKEANRRSIEFLLDLENSPTVVVGDSKKIRTVVQNLTANALKYTTSGSIKVSCKPFEEPEGLRSSNQTVVEIVVADSGCGIAQEKLDSIFREFEQVESSEPRSTTDAGVGLGLAVVARIIEQLGGQLRVDSKVDEGSRFSFLIPLSLSMEPESERPATPGSQHSSTRSGSMKSIRSEIDELVEALSADHMVPIRSPRQEDPNPMENSISRSMSRHSLAITSLPKKSIKVYESENGSSPPLYLTQLLDPQDNDINRKILAKRLTLSGGLDKVESDRGFDAVLMDIQMPILNGFEATRRIRDLEKSTVGSPPIKRLSHILNGRIPIFAVSASLFEHQRDELFEHGMDGWILKPIDFKR
ncbi:hypothetical protein BDQ17DRAFT_1386916 [Cyathus striatus]|nr:hypothetical protein BDQ17DRAFT_1386916 [Cyathus striatus]